MGQIFFSSALSSPGMPEDIGIPKDLLLCPGNFGPTGGGDGPAFIAMDEARLAVRLKSLKPGRTVTLNFEAAEQYFAVGPDLSEALNYAGAARTGAFARLVKRVRPDLLVELNIGPIAFNGDSWWKYADGTGKAVSDRMRMVVKILREQCFPYFDSLSCQTYFSRETPGKPINVDIWGGEGHARGLNQAWGDGVLSVHQGLIGYGLPVRYIFNLYYEEHSPSDLYQRPLSIDDFRSLMFYLRALGSDVLLWGVGPDDNYKANPAAHRWQQNHPLWQEVLRWHNLPWPKKG